VDPGPRNGTRLGDLLRGFRQAAGLTQLELAKQAGLSLGSVRDLEQGRTRRPLGETLSALVTALGLTTAQASELERASTDHGLWLQVLGPLAVWRDGTQVRLGGPAQRTVLGLLALSPGSLVHRASIIDVLWPDDPPANAVNLVQTHISRVRKALGPDAGRLLSSSGAGYRFGAGPGEIDALRFGQLTLNAHAAHSRDDHTAACHLYQQAIDLWQGEVLADLDLLRGHPAVAGLAHQRAEAVIAYGRAASVAGWHGRVIPVLRILAEQAPLNEQAHAQLMIALAGTGQQAEALNVYRDLCRRLDNELGVLPGPDLAEVHQLVLRQEIPAARDAVAVASLPAPPHSGVPVVVPRQLPTGVRHFAGRVTELAALSALLDGSGLDGSGLDGSQLDGSRAGGSGPVASSGPLGGGSAVVVAVVGGTAGVGKTTLVVHWAHRMADQFPDGQLYADLRGWGPSADPVTPADAISRFLDALGVPADQMPSSSEARQDLYRSLVAGRRMLIVLDNARDAAQVRPLLPGGSTCTVLVTSRSKLASLVAAEGAHPVALDVLSTAEARELLALRVGPGRVAAEPAAVSELLDLCAHLPLALVIAASRAALQQGMSVSALVTELNNANGRLAALDAGEGFSVRAVFSWSYHHLSEPARELFRLLGVHPGPDITVRAAASLAGTGPDQARELLSELTEASLLAEHIPGRFRFHDLLRDYAAERARRQDSELARRAAIHRGLDHYLHSAHNAERTLTTFAATITLDPPAPRVSPELFADSERSMAWFDAERHVLAAVVEQAVTTGFDTHAWQLPMTLGGFFDRKGHSESSLAVQWTALDAARRLDDHKALAEVHRRIGRSFVRIGAYQDAEHHYQQSLFLCVELGDHAGQARAHFGLGFVRDHQGRHHDALAHSSHALTLCQLVDDRVLRAAAVNNLGWCYARIGDYQQALTCCQQAIGMHQELGNREDEANAWDSIGYAHHHLGQYAEAVASYEKALVLFRQSGDRLYEAVILGRLGDTHEADGKPRLAAKAWRQAMAILDELHHDRAREKMRGRLARINGGPA
jgi:DNA-binding SARP family transcriptional activator/tetratricopeptide (TPR) repeat protein/DNA-binding XRE family transcriptional regulator